MRNILITGGAGFIGSSLAMKLSENKNNRVIVVDNLLTGLKSNLPLNRENLYFHKCDVNNIDEIKQIYNDYHFDYVFHYAAVVGVQRTLENPGEVLKDIKGIENIIELSIKTKVKRIFYASSSEIYGESVKFPQNENSTPLNSKLPYAVVKNVCEVFLHAAQSQHGLDYTIFRFFNTYGYRQSKDFVVSNFIRAAIENKPLKINGAGKQTRTFCYIDDNINTSVNCLNDDLFINGTMNIGSTEEISVLDLAKKIIKFTGSDSEIIFQPALVEGDMERRQPNNSKMRKVLKRDLVGFDEGLKLIADKLKGREK